MRYRFDLWPNEIEAERVFAPVTILREQAALLAERTKNLVQAEVAEEESEGDLFFFRFYLLAPVLGNYHYKLLTITHPIDLYPVKIIVEDSILNDVKNVLNVCTDDSLEIYRNKSYYIQVESEEEFINALRVIFHSDKVRKVLRSLLSQSDPEWTGTVTVTNGMEMHKEEDIAF